MPPALDILADAIEAMGASLPQFVRDVAFYGERPASAEAAAGEPDARKVALFVKCIVTEDVATPDGEAMAPTTERVFTVRFPASAWHEASPPQIGELVRFDPFGTGSPLWGKVASVSRMPNGDHKLTVSHLPKYAKL